jgi:hypothetical protein
MAERSTMRNLEEVSQGTGITYMDAANLNPHQLMILERGIEDGNWRKHIGHNPDIPKTDGGLLPDFYTKADSRQATIPVTVNGFGDKLRTAEITLVLFYQRNGNHQE